MELSKNSIIESPSSLTEIVKCPICDSNSFNLKIAVKDHSISKENFEIIQCTECNFLITSPRPADNEISKYYASEEYISHSGTKKGLINSLYHKVQKLNMNLKYRAFAKYVPRGTWMDYGAGNGAFLQYLESKKIVCEGFEPDATARKVASEKNISIQDSEEYKASSKQYSSITMWHVLEHIPNLNEIFQKHKSNLMPGGILTIAVPNHKSYDESFYKDYWAAYDVPRHLWHFSEKDVQSLLKKNGFEYIKTAPMIFDSYYVSMLSEKYKGGSLIRGIMIGALSNLKARFKKSAFSSQIYVFRKIDV